VGRNAPWLEWNAWPKKKKRALWLSGIKQGSINGFRRGSPIAEVPTPKMQIDLLQGNGKGWTLSRSQEVG